MRSLAVAIHDVEPATFERCALIRDWLDDLGVARVTLLVIPAPQLHPFPARSPELTNWLLDRVDAGDAVAQHGLQHRRTAPPSALTRPLRQWQGGRAAEFPGLDTKATIATVEAGLRRAHEGRTCSRAASSRPATRTPDRCGRTWRSASTGGRRCSRCAGRAGRARPRSAWDEQRNARPCVRIGAALSGSVLRLDLHPADFDHTRHVLALESVLQRARDRTAVTYDDLCSARAGFRSRPRG